MSDNVQLIKEEIERRMNNLWYLIPEGEKVLKDDFTKDDANNLGKYTALENLLKFIDSIQEETKPQFPNYESVVDKVFGAGNLESWEYEEAEKLVLLAKEELLKDLEINKEPASEDKSEKELSETYLAIFDKKYPILPTLKGKQKADFKNFLNKCQQEFGLKEFGIHPTQSKLFEKLTLLWAAWGAEHFEGLGKSNQDEFDKMSSEDLEEEMIRWHKEHFGNKRDWEKTSGEYLTKKSQLDIACHFAEWQKQQIMKNAVDATILDIDAQTIEFGLWPEKLLNIKEGDKVKIIIIK